MKTGSYYKILGKDLSKMVCISRTSPEWFPKNQNVQELMPSWSLLKNFKDGKITEEEYCQIYRNQLKKLDARALYNTIVSKYGNDCILLCWCGTTDFRHRHLAAEWFENELNIKIKEIGRNEYKRENGRLIEIEVQGELF